MQDEEIRHQMALMLLTSAPTLARVSSYPPPEFTAEIMELVIIVLPRLTAFVLLRFCCCCATLWTLSFTLLTKPNFTIQWAHICYRR